MDFSVIKYVYFIGVGGIGMSALARFFKANGKHVSGYDKTPTHLTDELIAEGIDIHFEDNIELINSAFRAQNVETLIIYTPAIPASHKELNYFKENKYILKKRSEVLGDITTGMYTIAVAGTHGKTTVSSMIAHMLKTAGMECTAFLGGISKNYGTNLLLPSLNTQSAQKPIVVVEADEYDRSFLTLHPDVAVITSMDADHLDIYESKENLEASYRLFAKQIKYGGRLFAKQGIGFKEKCTTYSLKDDAQYKAENIRIIDHNFSFDLKWAHEEIKDITIGLPGIHNIENAVAAAAVGKYLRIVNSSIRQALATYQGVKRRFDIQFANEHITYIDDYAHHPEELRACINSVKAMYPGKKITGIFQPHLFSRTRDFADGFAEALSLLDKLILLNIYPARELPIEGVTSAMILKKVTIENKMLCPDSYLLKEISERDPEVLLTLGAGDIDRFVQPIKNVLNDKFKVPH